MATIENVFGGTSAQGPQLNAHNLLQNDSLPTQRQVSGSSTVSGQAMKSKRAAADHLDASRPHTHSSSSRHTQSSLSTRTDVRASQREVRTLPPWIDSFEDNDDGSSKPTTRLLSSPSRVHSAQHHHSPSDPTRRMSKDGFVDDYDDAAHGMAEKKPGTGFFGGHRDPVKGRKWDHARNGEPVIMQSSGAFPTSSPWQTFVKASTYGPGVAEDAEKKDNKFLREQTPGYDKPWRGDLEGGEDADTFVNLLHNKKRQRTMIKRLQHTLLMNPFIPLNLRLFTLTTSTIALALSGSVHHFSNKFNYPQAPSTTMAIVVDVVAIPYIGFVTWDEYTGKPLGLRSPKTKIRLVLLDLFFIIFESANLALAFAAYTDNDGACQTGVNNGYNGIICRRISALVAILALALVAWSLTFSVSIFRLVERVGGREEND